MSVTPIEASLVFCDLNLSAYILQMGIGPEYMYALNNIALR